MENSNSNGGSPKLSLSKLDTENPEGTLGHAAAYGGMGLAVVPNRGKRPLLKEWQNARLDGEQIASRFADGQNVGLLNGGASGGLVTVDLDAAEAIAVADHLLLQTVRSGREGTPRAHAWYRSPGAKTRKWQDADGAMILELRSDGCQTLVPSSMHPSGEPYRWASEGVEEPAEVAAEELERRCTMLATSAVVARHMPAVGGRHEYAKAVLGLLMRRVGKEAALEMARAAWNAAGADGADALRDLDGIADDAERRLSEGGNVFGAPALSGMVPGLGELLVRWWGSDEDGPDELVASADGKGSPTQDELRDRWICGWRSPTAFGQGEWRRYDGGFWEPVHQETVNREIDVVLEGAKPEGTKPTAGTRASVEKLARAKWFVPDEAWDANEVIIVCANGTLEVPDGVLREHRPEDYALGAVPYAFDPAAEAPTWMRFLASTVPEAAPFLQEFAGYALTTDTAHEVAVWLQGPPGSGKSTFIEGVKAVLGDRAGLLGLAELQRSRFALAKLPGKTLAVATEQPSDFISVSHLLNALISGEEVRVEEKFRPAYAVVPRAKLLWAMNDLPRVKDANDGLFRRVKVVSFPKLAGEPDRRIKKAIKGEGAGILNWALEGLRRLGERGGFEVPDAVRAATEEFRLTNDVPRMFVEEACIVSDADGCTEQAKDLYSAYRHYCLTYGYKPMSLRKVATEWVRLGFEPKGRHGRTFYQGVKVDPGWATAQDDYPRGR